MIRAPIALCLVLAATCASAGEPHHKVRRQAPGFEPQKLHALFVECRDIGTNKARQIECESRYFAYLATMPEHRK